MTIDNRPFQIFQISDNPPRSLIFNQQTKINAQNIFENLKNLKSNKLMLGWT